MEIRFWLVDTFMLETSFMPTGGAHESVKEQLPVLNGMYIAPEAKKQ